MSTDAASSPHAALQVDPATLPDDAALLKSLVAQLFAELQSRDGRISDLEHRMSLLLRKLYGSKSEKLDPRQASLFDLLTTAAEGRSAVADDIPPAASDDNSADETPAAGQTPETYLGVGKMVNYGGPDTYSEGTADFTYPTRLADDTFAYRGRWKLDFQGATAESEDSRIALKYNAKNVYIVAGGEGDVTVTSNGKTTTVPISGAPTSHQLVSGDAVARGELEVRLSKGLQAFSFTYG